MTTDRELLEAAAKAAGFAEFNPEPNSSGKYNVGPATRADGAIEDGHWFMWNPLIDDGDAFRLSVKLNLTTQFEPEPDGAIVQVGAPWSEEFDGYWWNEWLHKDACAATRRAIVRAAAALSEKP